MPNVATEPSRPKRESFWGPGTGLAVGFTGVAVGLAAFLLDSALELLTRGAQDKSWKEVGWQDMGRHDEVAAFYLVVGPLSVLAVALVAGLLQRLSRHRLRFVDIAAWALLLPYLIPLWERFDSVLPRGSVWALLAAFVTLVAVAVWLAVLRWVSRATSWTGPAAIAALTLSLLLTVNRNLLPGPLAPRALAVDAAILLAMICLALVPELARRRWALRGNGAAVAAVVLVALLAVWMTRDAEQHRSTADFAGDPPPHVVLLSIDTLRYDIFDTFAETTPEGRDFLVALSGATFFVQAHAPSPWTAPSVATLMTGLLPDEHGYGVRTGSVDRPLAGLAAGIPTLAEGLRDAGYRTEAFVANPLLFPGSGIDRGFHSYLALEDFGRKLPWMAVLRLDPAIRRAVRKASGGRIRQLPYLQAEDVADRVVRRIRRIDDADRTPYFFWLHLMDPHAPYVGHPELGPMGVAEPSLDAYSSLHPKTARYGEEVRYALRHATRMLEALRAQGILDDAVTIFTSDHGEMFPRDRHRESRWGDHGPVRIAGHGHSLHGEVTRVPLAIRLPGASGAPRKSRLPVGLADLPPTLEDLLGLPLGLRNTASARSLAGSQVTHDRALTLAGNEWGPPQRGLILGPWKLIHFPGGEAADRVYDLQRDAKERWDLVKLRPDLAETLARRLDEAWEVLQAPPSSDPSAEAGEIDEETRQRLKALGYLM